MIAGAVAAGLFLAGGGAAHAAPADPGPAQNTPDYTTVLKPGPPIPVSNAEYSYLATHAVTKQLKRANVVGGIAALPVPAQYRLANDGLAFQFRRALDGALSTPGGCVQIVVSRGQAGSLFNYGMFAIEGQYCS